MKRTFFRVLLGLSLSTPFAVLAQSTQTILSGQKLRVPTSAVPFLNFTPDARSGALGEAGVALPDADANAVFWNPSKLIFAKQASGAAISYTPWLRELIGDMYYTYLSGYKKLGKNSVVAGSLVYFDLGTVDFTTATGVAAGSFNSREYALTASFSQRLSQNFALGVNLKYLNSNLAAGSTNQGLQPGATAAADISAYYRKEVRDNSTGQGLGWGFGAMISNLGGRLNYGGTERYFIPTNFRLGTGVTYYADQYNKFNFLVDVNKLMVPTPPVYATDPTTGQPIPIPGTNPVKYQIAQGKDPDRNYFSAVFGSFADAPGGLGEELREFTLSTGVEYWYNDQFAARVGYFNEANDKGGRKYITTGLGLRIQRLGVDFSYLLPIRQGNPLANTFRVSLIFNFGGGNRIGSSTDDDTAEASEPTNN